MFNVKTDNIEQITDSAIKQAQSGNPMDSLPIEYLQKVKQNFNNPMFIPFFKMFGLNKEECNSYLNQAISNKSGNKTISTNDKYKKGLEQLK